MRGYLKFFFWNPATLTKIYFSSIVISRANIILEETAAHPPSWWFRYVDDAHTKQKVQHVQEFIDHLNSIDNGIKFTNELEENNVPWPLARARWKPKG